MTTNSSSTERTRDPQELDNTIRSFVSLLSKDYFFAFVGNNNERYHGTMIAMFREEDKYAILINNAFKPSDPKGKYFYLETVEEILSFMERNPDVGNIIMGVSSNIHYIQIPRNKNGTIDLVELVCNTYQVAGTRTMRLVLPFDDKALKALTKALIPNTEVLMVPSLR